MKPAEFAVDGFAEPLAVLEPGQAHDMLKRLRRSGRPLEWSKGRAAGSAAWFAIASDPLIIDRVAAILGPNVMVWGASVVIRQPGEIHPWHTDIETSAALPGTLSVWIGMRNTTRESALMMISRSHEFGITIQERASAAGVRREAVSEKVAVEWARELNPQSDLVQYEMSDGDAIFFDGRLWHGSNNRLQDRTRFALLLQYAVPERAMRIPDLTVLDHPFRFREERHPPCVMVRGRDTAGVNRIVDPPLPRQ